MVRGNDRGGRIIDPAPSQPVGWTSLPTQVPLYRACVSTATRQDPCRAFSTSRQPSMTEGASCCAKPEEGIPAPRHANTGRRETGVDVMHLPLTAGIAPARATRVGQPSTPPQGWSMPKQEQPERSEDRRLSRDDEFLSQKRERKHHE